MVHHMGSILGPLLFVMTIIVGYHREVYWATFIPNYKNHGVPQGTVLRPLLFLIIFSFFTRHTHSSLDDGIGGEVDDGLHIIPGLQLRRARPHRAWSPRRVEEEHGSFCCPYHMPRREMVCWLLGQGIVGEYACAAGHRPLLKKVG